MFFCQRENTENSFFYGDRFEYEVSLRIVKVLEYAPQTSSWPSGNPERDTILAIARVVDAPSSEWGEVVGDQWHIEAPRGQIKGRMAELIKRLDSERHESK